MLTKTLFTKSTVAKHAGSITLERAMY